jgi:osmotically inducible protein OsmC
MSDEEPAATATAAGAESETEALHSAAVAWAGPLLGGGSGATPAELALTWESRTELPGGRTSPEELISAGLASCFTMMLAHLLAQDGHPVQSLHTEARAAKRIGSDFAIKRIELRVSGEVEGIDEQTFRDTAAIARRDCPAANALSGTEISLTAELL